MPRAGSRSPGRTPNVELPLPGLFALQARVFIFILVAPLALWLMPWPGPLRVLAVVLPPLFLLVGLAVLFSLRCPACTKVLMQKGLSILPRRKCPHCRDVVA
ncbi:hypothetical protein [Sandarakinorhabdus sp.]|uniref:hypothetical protein n=1 Tax=Sandarakinorhabdus sp. TaxID=1916663 RepID=UPI003F72A825